MEEIRIPEKIVTWDRWKRVQLNHGLKSEAEIAGFLLLHYEDSLAGIQSTVQCGHCQIPLTLTCQICADAQRPLTVTPGSSMSVKDESTKNISGDLCPGLGNKGHVNYDKPLFFSVQSAGTTVRIIKSGIKSRSSVTRNKTGNSRSATAKANSTSGKDIVGSSSAPSSIANTVVKVELCRLEDEAPSLMQSEENGTSLTESDSPSKPATIISADTTWNHDVIRTAPLVSTLAQNFSLSKRKRGKPTKKTQPPPPPPHEELRTETSNDHIEGFAALGDGDDGDFDDDVGDVSYDIGGFDDDDDDDTDIEMQDWVPKKKKPKKKAEKPKKKPRTSNVSKGGLEPEEPPMTAEEIREQLVKMVAEGDLESKAFSKCINKFLKTYAGSCPICNKSIKRLKDHLFTHSSKSFFPCKLCDMTFKHRSAVVAHVEKDHRTQKLSCAQCNATFDSNEDRKKHWIDEEHQPYVCEKCGARFCSYIGILNHRMKHNTTFKHTCSYCGKGFHFGCDLKDHCIAKHNVGTREFICPTCGKGFVNGRALRRHQILHQPKEHMCGVCGVAFHFSRHLVYHQRLHSAYKPYQCDFCEKSFKMKHVRDTHRRLHTGEKPYKCPDCHQAFPDSGNLVKHRRSNHGYNPKHGTHSPHPYGKRKTDDFEYGNSSQKDRSGRGGEGGGGERGGGGAVGVGFVPRKYIIEKYDYGGSSSHQHASHSGGNGSGRGGSHSHRGEGEGVGGEGAVGGVGVGLGHLPPLPPNTVDTVFPNFLTAAKWW